MSETAPPTPADAATSGTAARPAVAVVGARDNNLWSYLLFTNLEGFGSPEIWPVSRTRQTVRGVQTYADLDQLPHCPEVAAVAVAATASLPIVRQAVDLGVPHIILISAGFAELGTEEGEALQRELVAMVAGSGSRLYGPNGVGFADFRAGLAPLGAPIPPTTKVGPVSIISQSGSLTTSILGGLAEDGVGVDWCVSVGNGATFGVLDAVEASLDRPHTGVICGYLESLGGPGERPRLETLLERARDQGVRIVIAKSGASAVSAAIAKSHTAAIAGQDRLIGDVLAAHGVVRAGSMEELTRAAAISAYLSERGDAFARPNGGLAVIETSGGAAALVADLLSTEGVALATFAPETRQVLADVAPAGAFISNPIDLTASPKPYEDVTAAFAQVYADPAVRAVVIPYALTFPEEHDERIVHKRSLDRYADLGAQTGKPIIVSTLSDFAWTQWAQDFRTRHPEMLLVRGITSTVRTLAQLFPAEVSVHDIGPALQLGNAADGKTARDLLDAIGVPMPPAVFVAADDVEKAEAASAELSYPQVVKIVASGLLHKARVGGVRLGCQDAAHTGSATREVLAAAREHGLSAGQIRGVLIEETASGPQLLVSLDRDPWFGPFLIVGTGGAQAERAGDSRVLALPTDEAAIRAALPATVPPVHVDAVTRLVTDLAQHFLSGVLQSWASVELNPVMIDDDGPKVLDIVLLGPSSVTSSETSAGASA